MNPMNPLLYARLIGVLYLVLIIVGPFSLLYVPSTLIELGDPASTFKNIAESEFLFRLAQAGYAIVILADAVLAVLLYLLFRPVGELLALTSLVGRIGTAFVHSTILFINLLILLIVGGGDHLAAFTHEQVGALLQLFLKLQQGSGVVWGLFFAVHCLAIGVLGYQCGFIPKVVGLLMGATGIAYFINSFGMLLFPEAASALVAIAGIASIGELVFAGWLLIKGVNVTKWHRLNGTEVRQD